MHNVFADRYEPFYSQAILVLSSFRQETNIKVEIAAKNDFMERIRTAERTQDLPSLADEARLAIFVLPKIIADSTDFAVISEVTGWLSKKYGSGT